jgi:hypothetical protein
MGLDVYVYRCPDRAAARASEAEYEKLSEEVSSRLREQMFGTADWKGFDKYPQEKRDEFWSLYRQECEPLKRRFGMSTGEWSGHSTDEKIERDSTKHPEHYFKIGYFRSSYNDGGFNAYARRLGIPDLNEIFDNEDSEYEFVPDWAKARDAAIDALAVLRKKDFGFDVFSIEPNIFLGVPEITNENEALLAFKKQFDTWTDRKDDFRSYENKEGRFDVNGLTIHAAIPGMCKKLGTSIPCTYLVVKRTEENWYAQALEIVIETCNYVLEQPNREHYYLHWSG